jgi:hypothetical protein
MSIIISLGAIIGIIMLIGLYFLPTIIAGFRKKTNFTSILLLNFFLGWSLIGWVVAIVWAASVDNKPQQIIINNSGRNDNGI